MNATRELKTQITAEMIGINPSDSPNNPGSLRGSTRVGDGGFPIYMEVSWETLRKTIGKP